MAEFSAVGNLDVVPTGLDSAKREIERELGDLEVGVSANRPTGDGGGVGGPGTGSTAAMLAIQKKTLDAQRDSADFDEERNVILEDILDTLQDGGPGGGGGGGILRTAGTAGLALGGASALGGVVANPFTALAGLTLAGGAAAAATTTEAERQDQRGGPGPGLREPSTEFGTDRLTAADLPPGAQGFFANLAGDPAGRPGLQTTEPPDRAPRAGGTKSENNVNVDATANVEVSDSLRRSEIERFTERRIRQAAEDIKRDIERQLGSGTGPRTATAREIADSNPAGGGGLGTRLF